MAVHFDASTGHRASWGVANWFGATGLTIAWTFLMSAAPNGRRVCGQWESTNHWLIQMTDTNEIGFVVNRTGGGFYGPKTSGADLVSGVLYRVVCRVGDLDGTATRDIFINGSPAPITGWFNGTPGTMNDNAGGSTLRIGDPDGNAPEAGDYSEFAIWNSKLPDVACAAYGMGVKANDLALRPSFYSPMLYPADIDDVTRGRTGTLGIGATAPHPRMIQPRRRLTLNTVAAGGVFTPYYYQEHVARYAG